jgi:hypothetical protein
MAAEAGCRYVPPVRRGLLVLALVGACGAFFAVRGGAESQVGQVRTAGDFAVSASGPTAVTIKRCCVPPRVTYTVAFSYVGPPIGPLPEDRRTRFTLRTSEHLHSVGSEFSPEGANATDCATTLGTPTSYGPTWTEFSCTLIFTRDRTSQTLSASVRPSGRVGTATVSVSLSTGESATATTEFDRESAPAPPPPPPAPPPSAIPGPAAAPPRTITETFTRSGETEQEAVAISPTAETAQIVLTWSDKDSTFDVTGVQLVATAPLRTFGAAAGERRPRLAITKRRTARSVDVRIKRLQRGRLRFRIVARRVDGRTRVTAKVRQSRR